MIVLLQKKKRKRDQSPDLIDQDQILVENYLCPDIMNQIKVEQIEVENQPKRKKVDIPTFLDSKYCTFCLKR